MPIVVALGSDDLDDRIADWEAAKLVLRREFPESVEEGFAAAVAPAARRAAPVAVRRSKLSLLEGQLKYNIKATRTPEGDPAIELPAHYALYRAKTGNAFVEESMMDQLKPALEVASEKLQDKLDRYVELSVEVDRGI